MTLTLAILGLLTAAIPLLLWLFKRYGSPRSREEKNEALDQSFASALEAMAKYRQAGDDARADHLLRWLRLNGLPAANAQSGHGQCGPEYPAGGNASDLPEEGGGKPNEPTLPQ